MPKEGGARQRKPQGNEVSENWDTGDVAKGPTPWYENPQEVWEKLPQAHKIAVGSIVALVLFFFLLPYIGDPLGECEHNDSVPLRLPLHA
jgi:hypothetical protein